MSIGPVSGAYRIYGLGHTVQLGSVFTTPGPPPTNSLWPIEGHPEDAYGLAYFHLTRLNNGKYHISLASAPVVSSQSALWANASGGDPLIEWTIESIPQHGKTAHLISGPTNDPRGNFTRGWWTSFTPSTRPQAFLDGLLVSTPSIPPYYPSSKIFHIDELD
ncbi:hypothetical protein FA13DRAFT_1814924 [Coprinellus micaceus]|uniref:Uncharacterized protein n=1 Tax=Coprinellus micaceus TaxID=71717 RepID=A0A4Y7T789_COPMI|nr:hypothetical protein FA13DRAFT_1814924 [Coprinellus micaceus]